MRAVGGGEDWATETALRLVCGFSRCFPHNNKKKKKKKKKGDRRNSLLFAIAVVNEQKCKASSACSPHAP